MSCSRPMNLGMVESVSIGHQRSAASRATTLALSLVQILPFLMPMVDSSTVVVRLVTSLLLCPSVPVVLQDVHCAVVNAGPTWSLCQDVHQGFWACWTMVLCLWLEIKLGSSGQLVEGLLCHFFHQ